MTSDELLGASLPLEVSPMLNGVQHVVALSNTQPVAEAHADTGQKVVISTIG